VSNLFEQDSLPTMESSPADFLVRTYRLPVSEQDWQENGVDFSGKSADSLMRQDRRRLSSKMSLVYFPRITEETWPSSLKRWSSAGIAWDGGCLMLNTLEFPNGAVESSLSDVLETEGEDLKKYSLSAKAAQGILRRSGKKGKKLPESLQKALENVGNEIKESSI
jgi:hypothetical protein